MYSNNFFLTDRTKHQKSIELLKSINFQKFLTDRTKI